MLRKYSHVFSLARSWLAYAALPAAGLITAPILANALGPDGRGQLAGILQPLTLASAIAALGVPSAVTFFIGQRADHRAVLRSARHLAIAMTTLVTVGLLFYSEPVSRQLGLNRGCILLIWLALLPSAFIAVRRAHLQGERRYIRLDYERVLGATFRVVAMLFLWLVGVRSVFVFAAAYMLAGLSASASLRMNGGSLSSQRDSRAVTSGEFVKYSLFASFGTIATAMSARLDQALMPAVVAPSELGFYSVAVAIAEVSTIITTVVTRNVLAEVSGGHDLAATLRSVLLGGVAQMALICSIVAVLPYALPMLFGSGFSPAVIIVRILLVGAFLAYWSNVGSTYLSGKGHPALGSASQAAAALVTIVLFWATWSKVDGNVAAWISVCSQGVALIVSGMLVLTVAKSRTRFGSQV